MEDNKTLITLFLITLIKNAISMICFIILAIAFKKWWLSLFSILFCSSMNFSNKSGDSNE
jgi:hypothetical protein